MYKLVWSSSLTLFCFPPAHWLKRSHARPTVDIPERGNGRHDDISFFLQSASPFPYSLVHPIDWNGDSTRSHGMLHANIDSDLVSSSNRDPDCFALRGGEVQ